MSSSLRGRGHGLPTTTGIHRFRPPTVTAAASAYSHCDSDMSPSTSDNEGDSRSSQAAGNRRYGREGSRRVPMHSSLLKKRLVIQWEKQNQVKEQTGQIEQCLKEVEELLGQAREPSSAAGNSGVFSLVLTVFLLACILSIVFQVLVPFATSALGEVFYVNADHKAGVSNFPV